MTSPDVVATEADFPVEWADPADAEKTWEWDDMHTPTCLPPLAGDYAQMIAEGDAYASRRMAIPFEFRGKVVHGYVYYVARHDVPDNEVSAARDRANAIYREQVPLAAEYWRRAIVELQSMWAWIAAVPVEDLPQAELADAWDGAWHRGLRAWQIHFYAIVGPYEVLDKLADIYESVLTDAPNGEALRLTQGTIHELTDVEARMGRLTALASATAELKAAVARGEASVETLAALPGGSEFVADLLGFLDRHGHLGQSWDDLTLPSWGEEPWRLVEELRNRLDHETEPAHERAARLAREADELADAFRAKVAGDPEKLAEFERTLATAREIGHLTETHNYWIDRMGQARLRKLALRVGRRLVDAGIVNTADDVFYLHRAETSAVLREPADRTRLVAERRADLAHWSGIRPPAVIGRPKQDGPTNRFGGDTVTSDDPNVLRGTGASAGVARGPARVVLGPDDFSRVVPGDVIVAPSSNPSWVPLFAIAGGLVTNTGGVLSHAAVVAREFALPAVVGVANATSLIRDGQTVELDGTTGHVRLA